MFGISLRGWAGAAAVLILLAAPAAQAQTPPSVSEIAAYTDIHRAVARGDVHTLRKLARDGAMLAKTDAAGRTALHVATFLKRREMIPLLIRHKADTAALDAQKYDAVTIAAVADDPRTLKILLDNGASAKLVTSVYDGTALIAAAHLGHEECVRLLIRAGAPLDHVNALGWTALMESIVLGAGGKRHLATLKYLLDAKADPNLPDKQGVTPLAHAKARGFADMARKLERAGAR